jgi:hypothetical protein
MRSSVFLKGFHTLFHLHQLINCVPFVYVISPEFTNLKYILNSHMPTYCTGLLPRLTSSCLKEILLFYHISDPRTACFEATEGLHPRDSSLQYSVPSFAAQRVLNRLHSLFVLQRCTTVLSPWSMQLCADCFYIKFHTYKTRYYCT